MWNTTKMDKIILFNDIVADMTGHVNPRVTEQCYLSDYVQNIKIKVIVGAAA